MPAAVRWARSGSRSAARHAHDELVVDVVLHRASARLGLGRTRHLPLQARPRERIAVPGGVRAPRRRPGVQVRQFGLQHGGLQRIEPEIAPDEPVDVLLLHAVHPERAQFGEVGRGVAGGHAAISESTEVFRGEKAEPIQLAHGTSPERPPRRGGKVFGAQRLGCVLEHGQRELTAQLQDFVHGTTEPEKMHRDDGAQAFAGRRPEHAVGIAPGLVRQIMRHGGG